VLYRSPFMPYVLFQNFGPLRLEFELRCFTDDITNRLTIASDLRYDIRRRFKESHIEIPFPQQVVHLASSREGFPR
jgi:small-conductance mechanosensitive channel